MDVLPQLDASTGSRKCGGGLRPLSVADVRRAARAAALCAALAGCTRAEAARGAQDVVAVTHVTVVDVAAGTPAAAARGDQTVVIVDGRIASVGPAARVEVPGGARVVDGRNRYLIPGLWDAHAHVTSGGEAALAAYVANGVTTVRDLGGRLPELRAWRNEIRAGTRVGPRLLLAGPNLEGAWWLDAVVGFLASDTTVRGFDFLERSPRYRVGSPTEAPVVVDSLLRLGVDLIKSRNLRGDEFRAIVAEARRRGVPMVGHAPIRVSVGEAAEAGLRSFEHSETVTLRLGDAPDSVRRAELARVARAGSAITPTLVTDIAYRQTPDSVAYAVLADTTNAREHRRRYLARELLTAWKFGLDTKRFESPRSAESWAESHRRQVADTRLAHAVGVPLLVGTDLGVSLVYPGFSVHDEMRLLVEEIGLTPLEALRAATLAPARTMGMADSLGLIAPGRVADLVLLDADPLRDVRHTTRINAVVAAGRLLPREELDRVLEKAAQAAMKTLQPGR